MDKSIVALVPVDTYEQEAVDAAVRTGLDLLGGIGAFVKPEEKILLKPNLLSGALPQKAITTHPAVFAAVAKLLREAGYGHLSYGDSPGNPASSPDKAAADDASAEAPEEEADAGADDDDDDDVSTGEELSDLFNEDVVAGLVIGFVAGAALVGGGVLLHKLIFSD